MAILAEQPNVVAKISGLVMVDHNWTQSSLAPFVNTTLQTFGANRCMFASNFPVDKLNANYDELIEAYKQIANDFGLTPHEKRLVFRDNAINFYRL